MFLISFQDVSFMETFVFALRLQQLQCAALVLRLQTHEPRMRTVAESVLSLRQLGPHESEHCVHLKPASKSSVRSHSTRLNVCYWWVKSQHNLKMLTREHNISSQFELKMIFLQSNSFPCFQFLSFFELSFFLKIRTK